MGIILRNYEIGNSTQTELSAMNTSYFSNDTTFFSIMILFYLILYGKNSDHPNMEHYTFV